MAINRRQDPRLALARLAKELGTATSWPDDLAGLGQDLAEALAVRRYSLFSFARGGRLSLAFTWPPDEQPDEGLVRLAGELARADAAPAGPRNVDAAGLAFRGVAGSSGVVLAVPAAPAEAGRWKLPDRLAVAARRAMPSRRSSAEAQGDVTAALLAAMLDRWQKAVLLQRQVRKDELTGLANLPGLQEMLERQLAVHLRSGRPLALAALDIDRMKSYNQRFGRSAGDQLLKGFGAALQHRIRHQDIAARTDGEEFVVVLPGTDVGGGAELVEELRQPGAGRAPDGGRVTFSAGITVWDAIETGPDLIGRAEKALQAAKAAGGDNVVAGG